MIYNFRLIYKRNANFSLKNLGYLTKPTWLFVLRNSLYANVSRLLLKICYKHPSEMFFFSCLPPTWYCLAFFSFSMSEAVSDNSFFLQSFIHIKFSDYFCRNSINSTNSTSASEILQTIRLFFGQRPRRGRWPMLSHRGNFSSFFSSSSYVPPLEAQILASRPKS